MGETKRSARRQRQGRRDKVKHNKTQVTCVKVKVKVKEGNEGRSFTKKSLRRSKAKSSKATNKRHTLITYVKENSYHTDTNSYKQHVKHKIQHDCKQKVCTRLKQEGSQ